MPNLINEMTDADHSKENLGQYKFEEKKIYHCSNINIKGGGGIETYVASLLNCQTLDISHHLIASLKDVDQKHAVLLHIHSPELLWELTGECPAVFTVHNHSTYCPSGTKYLRDSGVCCDRTMNPLGCAVGHVVNGCGSRRPQQIIENIQRGYRHLEALTKFPVTIIANSDYVRSQLIANRLPPEKIVTLRCGVQIPKTASHPLTLETHQNRRILFAGRIVPDKGIEWLVKALAKTDLQVHLDIAGEGWGRPQVEKLADKLGLTNRITWHGWCSGEKLEALYQQCFAVVFPSLWPEPAGLVTLEAYAHHRPVIASAVGGIPEHVQDGKTGILVPPNDTKKLAEAINELAKNHEVSRKIGEQGYAWFLQEFTIDVHIQRLQKIYQKNIAEFQASRP